MRAKIIAIVIVIFAQSARCSPHPHRGAHSRRGNDHKAEKEIASLQGVSRIVPPSTTSSPDPVVPPFPEKCPHGLPLKDTFLEELLTRYVDNEDCRRHRSENSLQKDCTNLLPAADATLSVQKSLHYGFPENEKYFHRHTIHITPDIPCYVMPIRLPSSRFQSGFSLMLSKAGRYTNSTPYTQLPHFQTVDNFAYAISEPQHPGHQWAMETYSKAIHGLGHHISFWFASQTSYLNNLNCTRQELHLLCVEDLDHDWKNLMATFGTNATLGRTHTRSSGKAKSGTTKHLFRVAGAKDFWNKCLFPYDLRLHDHFCSHIKKA